MGPALLLGAGALALLALAGAVNRSIPGHASRRLVDLHPPFRHRVSRLLAELRRRGHRPAIRETWRSLDRQAHYVDVGWSEVERSYHTVTDADGDPDALAVDLADERWPPDDDRQVAFYRDLRQWAPAYDLATGGEWSRSGKWARFDLGWDPGHVEPRGGPSISAAHAGARPWPSEV